MTRLDYRRVLGEDFALARVQSPSGIYCELELDPLERAAHRFFRHRWESRPILAARAFRNAVFDSLPEDWLDAVLTEFQRLRRMSRPTGVRRTTTDGVAYWGSYGFERAPGKFPRRTYSAARYGETGAREMALFAHAQEAVRKARPELLEGKHHVEDCFS